MSKRIKLTPCEKCPLYARKEKDFNIPREFSKSPKWMVITDGSASKDDELFIKNFIEKYDGPVITHAVKCFDGDEPPTKAISLCREAYLEREIEEFKGDKIVLLGGVATHSVYRKKRRLRELIGMPLIQHGKQFLSVWHPRTFFYTGNKQVLLDIERAIKWATNLLQKK